MSIWDDTFELYGGGDRGDWNNPAVRAAWAAWDKQQGNTNSDAYNEFYGDNKKSSLQKSSDISQYQKNWDPTNQWKRFNDKKKLDEEGDEFDWNKWKSDNGKDIRDAEPDAYSFDAESATNPRNQSDLDTANKDYFDTANRIVLRNRGKITDEQFKNNDLSSVDWDALNRENFWDKDNPMKVYFDAGVTGDEIRANMNSMEDINALDQNNPLAKEYGGMNKFFIQNEGQRNIPLQRAQYHQFALGPGSLANNAELGSYADKLDNDWSKYLREDDPNTEQDESKQYIGQDIFMLEQGINPYDNNRQNGQDIDAWTKDRLIDHPRNIADAFKNNAGQIYKDIGNNVYELNDLTYRLLDQGLINPRLKDTSKGYGTLPEGILLAGLSSNTGKNNIASGSLHEIGNMLAPVKKDEEGNVNDEDNKEMNAKMNYGQGLLNSIILTSALGESNPNNINNIIGAEGSGLRKQMLGGNGEEGLLNRFLNYHDNTGAKTNYSYNLAPDLVYDPSYAADEGFDESQLKTLTGNPLEGIDSYGLLNSLQVEKALKKAGLRRRS